MKFGVDLSVLECISVNGNFEYGNEGSFRIHR